MILILPGKLRSEFLYSRLLSANCGERSAWPMVGAGKAGEFEEKTAGFRQKNGRKSEETAHFQNVSARRVTPPPA